ncbi:SusC/RagA family TonB-linked outer membrane protein [Mucilaginibacter sp. 14171R-50]|uniref:SusC/RagA family TonB-linked outer membrane protein n=1 Tax=Mucilaginibacter sp. 14171R-50 TaxID=2703789 RepID=UPI00138DB189|nr:SusC/RagA family TonB-linked outer membrane protein [Mucilaginibacter sp. 14171R-50]QHS57041.1 SusC/RagA family TonB-linked outer membrane protein [Mucilaginibacter sp. 14171R-50]
MKKHLLLFLLLVNCCALQVMAQSKTITGTVTSSADNLSMPGVTVKIKGTTTAVSTDVNGRYSINAAPGQVLVYSFIGNSPAERTVGSESVINVVLQPDLKSLQEVTITTGFGVRQEKRDLTSSVQVIKGSAVQATQRENFVTALQGRVAGANITSTSGQPGASASIVLRGITSIGASNQPLFVVDGIRVNNDALSQSSLASNGDNRRQDFTNRIADINSDDIENITVLKGADAAAVYGSDAAGGAIIITTKKGRSGNGALTYDNNFSFAKAYRFPEVQNTFGPGSSGNLDPLVRTAFGPAYAPGTQTYDNVRNIFQTGFTQQHDLALEGGNETATYRISTEYRHTGGVLPVAYNDKISLRLAGSAKLSSKLSSSASFNYFNIDNRKLNKGNSGTYINALAWPTNDDVRNYLNPDGSRRTLLPPSIKNVTTDASVDFDNPLWDAHKNISRDKTNRMLGNVDLSFDAASWLNLRALVGIDFYTTNGNNLLSQYSSSYQNSPLNSFAATNGISTGGIIDNYNDNNLLTNGSLFATFKKTFGDFRTTLAVGAEVYDNRDQINGFYGEKFLQPDFNTINNTTPTTQRNSSNFFETRRIGEIARLGIVYKEMLTINATGRQDYSSRLAGTQKSSYFYPSFGAGFIFTELPALKDNKVLSYGKLRFSYAGVGKDPFAPYKIKSSVIQQATTGGGFAYDVTGNNPNLRPEKDYQLDFGAELQFFEGRLGADISFYQYRATDQIFDPRISYGSGYILEFVNGGEIKNRGIEAQLTGIPVKTPNFTWNTFVNFTLNRGKVINLGDLPEYYNSDTWVYANARASIFPGSSLTNIAAYTYARNDKGQILVDPSSGLPISNNTFVTVGDRQPDFTVGFGNSFTYKSLNLSFLFDIRKGGDVFNANELFLTRYGLSARTLDRMQPRIIPGVLKDGNENSANPTVNTIQVTPYYQNTYYSAAMESDFVEHDINWLRLRDITLNYAIPQSVLAPSKVFKSASIFVTATDVFMLTNYSGADPDVNGNNSSTRGSGSAGFDYGTVATPRTISLGLRVKL